MTELLDNKKVRILALVQDWDDDDWVDFGAICHRAMAAHTAEHSVHVRRDGPDHVIITAPADGELRLSGDLPTRALAAKRKQEYRRKLKAKREGFVMVDGVPFRVDA